MKSIEKLELLRGEMKKNDLDVYIIPITDPHLGEYIPDHWRIISWLTGFSGSAANVVVTQDFAGLWTDSRYFIQAERELKGSGFDMIKLKIPHTPEYIDWMAANIADGSAIGLDGRIMPAGTVNLIRSTLRKKNISLDLDKDLISGIWEDRAPMPYSDVFEHEIKFAGESRESKIARLRDRMKESGVSKHLITSLDDIAWLLNIRSTDVNYSPLFTAYALIGLNDFQLFANSSRFPSALLKKINSAGVSILPYNEIAAKLSGLDKEVVQLTPSTCSASLFNAIPESNEIAEDISVPTRMKAIKNNTEINHIRNSQLKDGVALTKFFFWLEKKLGKEKITEISAADKLLEFRMEQEHCQGASFATIAGYNEHGASPHYCSTPETDVELKKDGIFLLDSGGQYLDGTTDTTRTICLGIPTDRQKSDFTLALKGTISLAMAKFPYGTKGFQLEILARKALWDNGLNYGHGTGHGVGFFLNVHEGPQTIGTGASGDLKTIIEPGMLISDEPAIYREGEYGFRTENLFVCIDDKKNDYGRFLNFETVTLCYIDTTLIESELLTTEERDWLNKYHKEVFEKLAPYLEDIVTDWLKEKTASI